MNLDTEFFFDEHNAAPTEAFSRLVKTLRQQQGMTQAEVANRLGISQKTYSSLERRIHLANFSRVSEVLGLLGYEVVVRHKYPSTVEAPLNLGLIDSKHNSR